MHKIRLKEVCSLSKGKQLNGDKLVENGAYDYLNGGIRPSGTWETFNVPGNTITISEGGNSCGYVNYMPNPFWCGAHCYYLHDLECNVKYLYYALKSQQERIMKLRSGACMPNIKKKDIGDFSFTYTADAAAQTSIAQHLDKVSRITDLCNAMLDKLDMLVKARFLEMFGDPVANEKAWTAIPLDDACDGIGDGLHGTPEYDDNGAYPFINGNNLMEGKIVITPATKMVDEATYRKHFIEINDNAILISINGTLGKTAFYNGEALMLGKSACYCNLKSTINRIFVHGVMQSDAFAEFLEKHSTKSTIKNVGLKAMREFQLIIPPTALQEQFAAFAEQTDKSKLAVRKELEKAETLKQALMQEYFG